MEFEEFIKECRRPFPPEAILFRVGATSASAALILHYIDARHVSERLNQLIPGGWSSHYNPINSGTKLEGIQCNLSISLDNNLVTRSDVGTLIASDDMGGIKAMYSDALKRAAVHFGIGVSLYAQPTTWVPADKNGTTYIKKNKAGKLAYVQDVAVEGLRTKYVAWLKSDVSSKFGEHVEVS